MSATLNVFINRHAPTTFSQLVLQDALVQSALALYAKRRRYDNILLYGPFGSAKSTTARLIIEERQRLIGSVSTNVVRYSGRELKGEFKEKVENDIAMICNITFGGDPEPFILIDEVDQMTQNAQYDLRDLMDTLPIGKFVMTTNNFSGVDGGVRDRSECFEILHPAPVQWLARATEIVNNEGFKTTNDTLLQMISTSSHNGAPPTVREVMRALNTLVISLQAVNGASTATSVTPAANAGSLSMNAVLQAQGITPKRK